MGWTVEDIANDLKELKRLFNEETNPSKKVEIAGYIGRLEKVLIAYSFDRKGPSINDNNFFTCLDRFPPYRVELPHIRDFLRSFIGLKVHIDIKEREEKHYSREDMDELVHDFYKSVGGIYYDKFLEYEKEKDSRVNYTKIPTVESASHVVPLLNKYYINIGTESDDREVLESLVHEIGHILAFKINYKRYESNKEFREIETLFLQDLADRYFAKVTNDKYFTDMEVLRIIHYYSIADLFDSIGNAYDLIMDNALKVEEPNDLFLDMVKEQGITKFPEKNVYNNMNYLFSYICALELVEMYREDKDKALDILTEIIRNNDASTEYERITEHITPNRHVKKYVKELKKVNSD